MPKTPENQPSPPTSLQRLQDGFGRSISTPFSFDDPTGVECQIDLYDTDVLATMIPRGDLTGVERLAIYNQQYWFRLLTVMQNEYPLFERVLGVRTFNRLVTAYLDAVPSTNPSLRYLSNHFAQFVRRSNEFGSSINIEIAELEYLYIHAFDAAEESLLLLETPEAAAAAMQAPLKFQPHVRLYETHWNLVECRKEVRTQPDLTTISPEACEGFWGVFRSPRGVSTREVTRLEWSLLTRLYEGVPFGEACEAAAEDLNEVELAAFAEGIQRWFTEWAALGWFTG